MKKVLVTGATGFIGNYLIQELLFRNFEIIATSSNTEKAESFKWFSQVTYKSLDFNQLNNSINYYEYFEEPDLLIHLAWEGLPNYKEAFHVTENLPKHKLFLANLIKNGLKNVLVTGTCFEYGLQEGELNEEMECEPNNTYAIAKNELRIFLESFKIDVKWLRLFYMFGKGQSQKSLISQLDNALNNNDEVFNMSGGEQVRDFLPVEIIAENIVNISMQNKVSGIINCCSGIPITVKQFVENYIEKKQKKIKLNLGYYPYPDFEPMHFWGNNNKLKQLLKNV